MQKTGFLGLRCFWALLHCARNSRSANYCEHSSPAVPQRAKPNPKRNRRAKTWLNRRGSTEEVRVTSNYIESLAPCKDWVIRKNEFLTNSSSKKGEFNHKTRIATIHTPNKSSVQQKP